MRAVELRKLLEEARGAGEEDVVMPLVRRRSASSWRLAAAIGLAHLVSASIGAALAWWIR